MLTAALVRPAVLADRRQLSDLLSLEARMHRHLDWRYPLDWLGSPFYWTLAEGAQIAAALACPPEAPRQFWIRWFAVANSWDPQQAWERVWQTAHEAIIQSGGGRAAAIVTQPWFQSALAASGFENLQAIVMLERERQPQARREARRVRIRAMRAADLPAVARIDSAAFEPLWQNSQETLRAAFSQALIASAAEEDGRMVGYQISTGAGGRAHLARLAVCPGAQRRGVASGLLEDLIARLNEYGASKLSVNTQSDNFSSLHLYQKLGFRRTGAEYPVYAWDAPRQSAL